MKCHSYFPREAGVVPTSRAFYMAIRAEEDDAALCQLFVQHGGNPFLMVPDDTRDEGDDDDDDDEGEEDETLTLTIVTSILLLGAAP